MLGIGAAVVPGSVVVGGVDVLSPQLKSKADKDTAINKEKSLFMP